MPTATIDALVKRLAALLTEVEDLGRSESGRAELKSLADAPARGWSNDQANKAYNLLRGLLRTWNVANRANLGIASEGGAEARVVPAAPGFFVINLLPEPGGGFHGEQVIKNPVIAWKVEEDGCARPIVAGEGVCDRWAVLAPTGCVISDPFTSIFADSLVPLSAWIRAEVEWLEEHVEAGSRSVSWVVFQSRGPLPRALWFMMDSHIDGVWRGTPEGLLHVLSLFRDDRFVSGWPTSPAAPFAGSGGPGDDSALCRPFDFPGTGERSPADRAHRSCRKDAMTIFCHSRRLRRHSGSASSPDPEGHGLGSAREKETVCRHLLHGFQSRD